MESGEVGSAGKLRTSAIEKRKRGELGEGFLRTGEDRQAGLLVKRKTATDVPREAAKLAKRLPSRPCVEEVIRAR